MGNFLLRKLVRKTLEEYGNYSPNKVASYTGGDIHFPNYDKENISTPSDLDFWNDIEFEDSDNFEDLEDEDNEGK